MRRARATVLLASLALVVTGCATLPTSGPVQEGMTAAPVAGTIQYEASGPAIGAGPTEIIEGFLQAGAAGLSGENDFEVAHSFLTAGAGADWQPLSQVIISANEAPQVPVMTLPEPAASDDADDAADASDAVSEPPGTSTTGEEGGALTIEDVEDLDRVQVRLSVVAVADVDASGIYTAASSAAASELTYELVRVGQEWRIDSVPAGLLLSEVAFGNVFRAVPVMFLTPDLASLVPDVRYVPTRNAVSHALDLLVAGPAPWLSPGVVTRVGRGMTLEQPGAGVAVTEDNGQAEVRLTGGDQLTEDDRALLFTQVSETLGTIPGIQGVALWIGGSRYQPMTDSPSPALLELVSGPITALSDGVLVHVDGSSITPYLGASGTGDDGARDDDGGGGDPDGDGPPSDGASADGSPTDEPSPAPTEPTPAGPEAAETPTSPEGPEPPAPTDPPAAPEADAAAALVGLRRPAPAYAEADGLAVLQGTRTLLHVSPDGGRSVLVEGEDLLAPSQDRLGWILTGERDNAGALVAVTPAGARSEVAADFLIGKVVQVRFSRDGARAAVMSEVDGVAEVRIAVVVRDAQGAPVRLQVGPTLVGDMASGLGLVWVDGTSLAVLASQETGAVPSVRSVGVSGPVGPVSTTTQAVSLAAGNGLGELYLATAENRLLGRVSLRWEEVASPVVDPAFPG